MFPQTDKKVKEAEQRRQEEKNHSVIVGTSPVEDGLQLFPAGKHWNVNYAPELSQS